MQTGRGHVHGWCLEYRKAGTRIRSVISPVEKFTEFSRDDLRAGSPINSPVAWMWCKAAFR